MGELQRQLEENRASKLEIDASDRLKDAVTELTGGVGLAVAAEAMKPMNLMGARLAAEAIKPMDGLAKTLGLIASKSVLGFCSGGRQETSPPASGRIVGV